MINSRFKYFLAAVVAIVTTVAACAGDFEKKNLSLGFKGGMSLSRVNFQSSVPQKMLGGIIIGASVRYIEENHFGLIGEINFEQRGWNENFAPLEGYSFKRKFSYIQIPLLSHIYFGSDRARFFINAGPEIGLMISDNRSSNFDYNNASSIEEIASSFHQTDQYILPVKRKFDYGISAGLGVELNINKKNAINLEGRFYYGLNDVFSNRKSDPFQGSSGMSIMVTLGYNLRLK